MGSGLIFMLKSIAGDLHPPPPPLLPDQYPDLTGQVALVTGASAGIGYEVAKLLSSKNCRVFMGVRSEAKAQLARTRILQELGNNDGSPIGSLELVIFDLADLTTIKGGAEHLISQTDKLNYIVHNAGVMLPPAGAKTVQGYELQFGTNVIGPFLLQKYLDPLFLKPNNGAEEKRIIWASSVGHLQSPVEGGIDWDDLNFLKNPKSVMKLYSQSKLCDAILAGMWPQHHGLEVEAQKIVSISVHPGLIRSELSRYLPRWAERGYYLMTFDSKYGAYTELYGVLSKNISYKDNGGYYIPWGRPGDLRDDVKESITNGNGEKLWKYLEKETSKY